MRTLALLPVCGWLFAAWLLPGCAGSSADAEDDTTNGDLADTGPADEKVDTGLALVYSEGRASFAEEAWVGEEAYVATSTDGAVEHCRIVNAVEGSPSAELCPGCSFAFDVVFGAGTATGEGCDNMRFTAEMADGDAWTYAFAPTYAYGPEGYTYDDVLLFGYEYGGTFRWTPWALAEVRDGPSDIDYESIFEYQAYYFFL